MTEAGAPTSLVAPHALLDNRVTLFEHRGQEWGAHTLWQACWEASQALPKVATGLKAAHTPDPLSGEPAWQTWLRMGPQSQLTRRFQIEVGSLAAFHHVAVDPTVLDTVLSPLQGQPITAWEAAFLAPLLAHLARRGNNHFEWGTPGSEEASLASRQAHVTRLLDYVSVDQLPGAAYAILNDAVEWRQEWHAWAPLLWRGQPLPEQDHRANLMRTALERQSMWVSRERARGQTFADPDVAAWVPSEVAGMAVVDQMVQGLPLSSLLRTSLDGPLPVQAWLDAVTPGGLYKGIGGWQMDTGPAVYGALEKALDNPIYPSALRQRLYEACRPLRPLVAETRFIHEERLGELQKRPLPSAPPRRPRA